MRLGEYLEVLATWSLRLAAVAFLASLAIGLLYPLWEIGSGVARLVGLAPQAFGDEPELAGWVGVGLIALIMIPFAAGLILKALATLATAAIRYPDDDLTIEDRIFQVGMRGKNRHRRQDELRELEAMEESGASLWRPTAKRDGAGSRPGE